jgi:hypothetical protein
MLPLHVGGDLDPRHVPEVDRHLHDCLVCFREFRELGTMRGRLGVLAEEPLPAGILDGFVEEVMARIDVGEPGPAAEAPTPGPRQRISSFRQLSAAAAVMLVALAGWRALSDQGTLAPNDPTIDMGSGLSGSVSNGQAARPLASPQSLPLLRIVPQQRQRSSGPGTSSRAPDHGTDALATKPSVDDLLEIAWPKGVPVETSVQVILRSIPGQPGGGQQDQGSQASGLQLDDQREPRERRPGG